MQYLYKKIKKHTVLIPNFEITSTGPISLVFSAKNIYTFTEAYRFVKELPYGRNKNKENLITLFSDNCGTCSTKHALLKRLADEHHFNGLELMLGLFRMNSKNTPAISQTLNKYGLGYIPEAHNYIRYGLAILDCTTRTSQPSGFINDLISEITISAEQITDYKVNYHRSYLIKWLREHPEIALTPEELWAVREECIQAIASKNV